MQQDCSCTRVNGPTGTGSMATGPDAAESQPGQVCGSPGSQEITASFDDSFIPGRSLHGAARQRPGLTTDGFQTAMDSADCGRVQYGQGPMLQATHRNSFAMPVCDLPAYSSSRSAIGMGADCYRHVAAAPFGGNSAHFDLRPSQTLDNRSSFHLLPPVSNSISNNQALSIKNGSSWAGALGLYGMHLPEGASIGVPSADVAGYLADWNGPTKSPLFVGQNGTLVVRSEVVAAIRWLAGQLGLPAADFAGHSLRRGGATSTLMAGASILVIEALGRWRFNSFHQYLEAPDCFLTQQVANMAPAAPVGSTLWPEIQWQPPLGQ